jgi:CRP/FNR family transcriptional regulator, cyclic AMP receptor protein
MKKVLFLFGELSDLDIDWLVRHGTAQQVSKGSILIEEGGPISGFYIVLDGLFEVLVGARERKAIGRMGTGEILGEISFVDSRPPTTTLQALTDSVVFVMSRGILKAKLEEDPGFASRFYRAIAMFLSHRLRLLTLKFAQTQCDGGSPGTETPGELDEDVLSGVYLGGKRFERMVKRLTVS